MWKPRFPAEKFQHTVGAKIKIKNNKNLDALESVTDAFDFILP